MIVLDTHVLIWDALNPDKIHPQVYRSIEAADDRNELLIPDISLWEIAMLIDKRRLEIDSDTNSFISALLMLRNYSIVAIDSEIASKAVELGQVIMTDPADSLIAATAFVRNATLVTADQRIIDSGTVKTVWI